MGAILRKILIFVNIALYLTTLATWISLTEYVTLNISATIASISLTMILLMGSWKKIADFALSSYFKNLCNVGIRLSLILMILGLVNYLGYKHPVNVDLSSDSVNTLSDQTKVVLNSIEKDAKIIIFTTKNKRQLWSSLLDLYREIKPNLEIDFIDPEVSPEKARKLKIDTMGSFIVRIGDRRARGKGRTELQLTNTLIKAKRVKDFHLAFTIGHREGNLKDASEKGLNQIRKKLETSEFKISYLDLASISQVPENIDLLFVWGPKDGFLDVEVKKIDSFIKSGKNLVVALDPNFEGEKQTHLKKLLKSHGIVIHNDLVFDQVSHVAGSSSSIPIIKKFNKDHPITKNFQGGTFFPLTSSVEKVEGDKDVLVLARTSGFPASWAERDLSEVQAGSVVFNQKLDQKGPVGVMAVTERDGGAGKYRIAAFGNSTFIMNNYIQYGANYNFFFNVVEWALSQESFISLNRPEIKNNTLMLGDTQVGIVFYFSVLFAPLLLFGISIYLYRRRKAL